MGYQDHPFDKLQLVENRGQKATADSISITLSSDHGPVPFTPGGDVDFGATTNAGRRAAIIGNTTGQAAFGSGVVSTQTLRVTLPTDQPAVDVTQSGTWNITNISGTVSLPTGAATESTLSSIDTTLTSILAAVDDPAEGRAKVELIYNDYTSTSITTGAYVELVASTSGTINYLDIFDSSGEAVIIALGAAASEVETYYIAPGGNGVVQLNIPSGTRISAKALTANATSGFLLITALS